MLRALHELFHLLLSPWTGVGAGKGSSGRSRKAWWGGVRRAGLKAWQLSEDFLPRGGTGHTSHSLGTLQEVKLQGWSRWLAGAQQIRLGCQRSMTATSGMNRRPAAHSANLSMTPLTVLTCKMRAIDKVPPRVGRKIE